MGQSEKIKIGDITGKNVDAIVNRGISASTGGFDYPKYKAALVSSNAIKESLAQNPHFQKISLNLLIQIRRAKISKASKF